MTDLDSTGNEWIFAGIQVYSSLRLGKCDGYCQWTRPPLGKKRRVLCNSRVKVAGAIEANVTCMERTVQKHGSTKSCLCENHLNLRLGVVKHTEFDKISMKVA